jgi:hypothetical protein
MLCSFTLLYSLPNKGKETNTNDNRTASGRGKEVVQSRGIPLDAAAIEYRSATFDLNADSHGYDSIIRYVL